LTFQTGLNQLSREWKFVALAETPRQSGTVIDLSSAKPTMQLQRDNYHSDVSHFPVAFLCLARKELIVHGTNGTALIFRTQPRVLF